MYHDDIACIMDIMMTARPANASDVQTALVHRMVQSGAISHPIDYPDAVWRRIQRHPHDHDTGHVVAIIGRHAIPAVATWMPLPDISEMMALAALNTVDERQGDTNAAAAYIHFIHSLADLPIDAKGFISTTINAPDMNEPTRLLTLDALRILTHGGIWNHGAGLMSVNAVSLQRMIGDVMDGLPDDFIREDMMA